MVSESLPKDTFSGQAGLMSTSKTVKSFEVPLDIEKRAIRAREQRKV